MDINFLKQNGVDTDKALELFGDMDIYNETFQDYLDGIDEKLKNLERSKNNENWADYGIFAHSIKSDARYLGFTKEAEIFLAHEMAGKEANQHFIEKEYDNLLKTVAYMTSIVKRYLNGEKALTRLPEKENSQPVTINNEPKEEIVLIADDSKIVDNFALKVMEGKYKGVVAIDGKEAIDIISSNKYNILAILLDLNMPNVGGFEVLEYLKNSNHYSNIPISIITGEDSKDMIDKAFQYNIVDMLVKPFSKNDFLRVLDKTINLKK
ncbi:MAG: response regulator [bacterium]|nr:response regulator [bacterium]